MRWFFIAALMWSACGEAPWPRVVPDPARPDPARRGSADVGVPEAGAPTTGQGGTTLAPDLIAALTPVYAFNDALHEALSGDRFEGVQALAAKLGDTARAARAMTQEPGLAARLGEIETQARALGASADPDTVRRVYGEVSRLLVSLATDVPVLREGRFVFMCPMASGYQKWLQREPSLRNPYFGAKMLTCGETSDWRP